MRFNQVLLGILFMGLTISGNSFAKDKKRRTFTFKERLQRLQDARLKMKQENKKTASQISEEVMGTLKEKGLDGVKELKTKVRGQDAKAIAKEMGKEEPDDFERLEANMAKNGGVKEISPMPERYQKKVNGHLIQESYKLEYKDGSVQIINLKYIKPTITGGMELMEVTVD